MSENNQLKNPFSSLQIILIGLFVTALATAQVISSKVLLVSLPILGTLTLPGGTFAYAFTFFASDCVSELYGKKNATKMVNIAFFMNFVLLGLVWLTISLPAAGNSIDPSMFRNVLGAGTNIVLGSLGAYIISQNLDVRIFHKIRDYTNGQYLFIRNIGSTVVSQFVDTVIFTVIAFALVPLVIGTGTALPQSVIISAIIGQFTFKMLIALVDTPFVYAVVKWARGEF